MEEELDAIEEGTSTWVETLEGFYTKFEKDLTEAAVNMENIKRQELPTDEVCDKCGKPMVIKWGQFGSFFGVHRVSGLFEHERNQARRGRRARSKDRRRVD